MSWMKISFEGADRFTDLEAFRAAFVQVWIDISEDDCAALYATRIEGRDWPDVVTAYVSPVAAEVALTRMTGFSFTSCDRPDASQVYMSVGSTNAHDPSWCDLTESEREAIRERDSAAWDEDPEPDSIEVLQSYEFRTPAA